MTTGQFVVIRYFYVYDEDSERDLGDHPRKRTVRVICIQQWLLSPAPAMDEAAVRIDALARGLATARAQVATGESVCVQTQRSAEESKLLDQFRDAASGYLAEKLTGPPPIATQPWSSDDMFLPADVAGAIARFNDRLNEGVADCLEQLAKTGGPPALTVPVVADVGAGMILRPITEPLGTSVAALELVGLAIALAAGVPALTVICTKGLLHQAATDLTAQVIDKALKEITSVDTPALTQREETPQTVLGKRAFENDVVKEPTPKEILENAADADEDPSVSLADAADEDLDASPAAKALDSY